MKINIDFRSKEPDWKTMIRLENDLETRVNKETQKAAERLAEAIREEWSPPPAPSNAGSPPAHDEEVNTGNLDSAVVHVKGGARDIKGRFAKSAEGFALVRVDTTKGKHPKEKRGKYQRGQYATALEEGTYRMQARPFFFNAVEKVQNEILNDIKLAAKKTFT